MLLLKQLKAIIIYIIIGIKKIILNVARFTALICVYGGTTEFKCQVPIVL